MSISSRALPLLLAAALPGLAAAPGAAQDVNLARLDPGHVRMYASVGLDPAVVTTIGVSRTFDLYGHGALGFVDFGLASAEVDLEDARSRVGAQVTLWSYREWRLAGRGILTAQRTSNSVYHGTGFGADLAASIGYYRHRWFAAALLGYDRTVVMHLEHTRWYRDNVYADAVDGWYRGESGLLHGGPMLGLAAGPTEIVAGVEWRRLDGGAPIDPPFVGRLSLGLPF